PVRLDPPSTVAVLLVRLTLLPPVVVNVTAPVRLLAALLSVTVFAPALTVVVPATVQAALWVTASVLVSVALAALVRLTAPENALAALLRVIAPAVVVKLAVLPPLTVMPAAWVIKPPEVTVRVPPN